MSVYRRPGGRIWWYEFKFRGQRIRASSGSGSKTLAVRAERQRRRKLEESVNGLAPIRQPALFSTTSKDWIETNKAHWSDSYRDIHKFNLKHLTKFFCKLLNSDITPAHVGKYQLLRKEEGASNRTINLEIGTLRLILKSERLWDAIAPDVKMLRESTQIGKALDAEEEARLLDACRKSSSPSLYPAVVIFCNTGLRNAELREAKWSQVDFLRAEFRVGMAKTEGSTGRIIPLNQTALDAFKRWRARCTDAQPEDYIFPSEKLVFKGEGSADRGQMTCYGLDRSKPLSSWKTAWSTAKLTAGVQCRIHDLRHHFISSLAQTQTADATIQAISGHLSHKMLEHYSHVRLDAKRRAVASLDSHVGSAHKPTSDSATAQTAESGVPTKVPTAEDVN